MPDTASDAPVPFVARKNDPRIKAIRLLAHRAERERTGLFLIEGVRFVARAAEAHAPIETLVVAPRLLTSPSGRRLVHRLHQAGIPRLDVGSDVFRALARADPPQGVAAVVRQRWTPLAEARPDDGLCWVAVEGVRTLGNLGAILRTGEAVGAAGAILVGDAANPFAPAAVRATMGAHFAQRLVRASFADLVAWARDHRACLVGTSPRCDAAVRLPMVGRGDSLILAVATGVLPYEVFGQRRARPASAGPVDRTAGAV